MTARTVVVRHPLPGFTGTHPGVPGVEFVDGVAEYDPDLAPLAHEVFLTHAPPPFHFVSGLTDSESRAYEARYVDPAERHEEAARHLEELTGQKFAGQTGVEWDGLRWVKPERQAGVRVVRGE